MMSPQSKSRQNTITGQKRETKVNFFDPKGQIGLDNEDDEPKEEQMIIETKIDPLEWNKEMDRVYNTLDKIEQEVEILKTTGGDNSEFDEYLRHYELIVEMCREIKQASHLDVRKCFQSSVEMLES
jgi:hypothetical protein